MGVRRRLFPSGAHLSHDDAAMAANSRRLGKLVLWLLLAVIAFVLYRWSVAYRKQQQLAEKINLTIERPTAPEADRSFTVSVRNNSSVTINGQEVSFIAEGLFNDVEVEQEVGNFDGPIPPGETAHKEVRFQATIDDCRVRLSPVAFFPGSNYFTRVYRPHKVFKGEDSQGENPQ
jgi:hypothetical protein